MTEHQTLRLDVDDFVDAGVVATRDRERARHNS